GNVTVCNLIRLLRIASLTLRFTAPGVLMIDEAAYAVNDVLKLLEREGVFKRLGKRRTREVVLAILRMPRVHCSPRETLLYEVADVVGVCPRCETAADDVEGGLCATCQEKKRLAWEAMGWR